MHCTKLPGCYLIGIVLAITARSPGSADEASQDAVRDQIRVAVITQQDGPHLSIYLSALAASSSVAKVAVVDASGTTFDDASQHLGKHAPDFLRFGDTPSMLDRFQPELVIVALAAHRAPDNIRQALTAGSHVLAEKPACVRADDFQDLVGLAQKHQRNLMLALPSRLSPDIRRARQIVDAGWLGKLYGVTFFQVKDQSRLTRPSYHQSWFASPATAGGGHLIWLGIHNFDQVLFITQDRVSRVTALTNNVGGQPVTIEDAEAVSLRFQSGMVGSFHGGYYVEGGSMQSSTSIWGSSGWLKINSYRGPDGSQREFQWYSTHPDAPRGVQTESNPQTVNTYFALVQAAVDTARGAAPAPLTADECLHILKTIFGAYRAADTGTTQVVELER